MSHKDKSDKTPNNNGEEHHNLKTPAKKIKIGYGLDDSLGQIIDPDSIGEKGIVILRKQHELSDKEKREIEIELHKIADKNKIVLHGKGLDYFALLISKSNQIAIKELFALSEIYAWDPNISGTNPGGTISLGTKESRYTDKTKREIRNQDGLLLGFEQIIRAEKPSDLERILIKSQNRILLQIGETDHYLSIFLEENTPNMLGEIAINKLEEFIALGESSFAKMCMYATPLIYAITELDAIKKIPLSPQDVLDLTNATRINEENINILFPKNENEYYSHRIHEALRLVDPEIKKNEELNDFKEKFKTNLEYQPIIAAMLKNDFEEKFKHLTIGYEFIPDINENPLAEETEQKCRYFSRFYQQSKQKIKYAAAAALIIGSSIISSYTCNKNRQEIIQVAREIKEELYPKDQPYSNKNNAAGTKNNKELEEKPKKDIEKIPAAKDIEKIIAEEDKDNKNSTVQTDTQEKTAKDAQQNNQESIYSSQIRFSKVAFRKNKYEDKSAKDNDTRIISMSSLEKETGYNIITEIRGHAKGIENNRAVLSNGKINYIVELMEGKAEFNVPKEFGENIKFLGVGQLNDNDKFLYTSSIEDIRISDIKAKDVKNPAPAHIQGSIDDATNFSEKTASNQSIFPEIEDYALLEEAITIEMQQKKQKDIYVKNFQQKKLSLDESINNMKNYLKHVKTSKAETAYKMMTNITTSDTLKEAYAISAGFAQGIWKIKDRAEALMELDGNMTRNEFEALSRYIKDEIVPDMDKRITSGINFALKYLEKNKVITETQELDNAKRWILTAQNLRDKKVLGQGVYNLADKAREIYVKNGLYSEKKDRLSRTFDTRLAA